MTLPVAYADSTPSSLMATDEMKVDQIIKEFDKLFVDLSTMDSMGEYVKKTDVENLMLDVRILLGKLS